MVRKRKIDLKILLISIFVVDVLGTIDFIDVTDGTIVFRTTEREKDKVIVQLGTCDPQRALKVAKLM